MLRPYVLDVGSGYNPDPRADVLVERDIPGISIPSIPSIPESVSRVSRLSRYTSKVVIREGQQMICADMAALPFIDKAFDFVLCFQTLEHVDDPDKACRELVRVASAGFLTAPSEQATIDDIKAGRRIYHKWLAKQGPHSTYGTHLTFIPRDKVLDYDSPGYADRHVIMFWIGDFTWEVTS